jgi:predicted phosphate transport protein (TIGR00153 family)
VTGGRQGAHAPGAVAQKPQPGTLGLAAKSGRRRRRGDPIGPLPPGRLNRPGAAGPDARACLIESGKREALMLGWFRALMPREERFFELFARHAQLTLAAAEALRALLNGGDDVLRHCKEIGARENEADEVTREVLTALRRTFITPLDRGDIKDLITSMDDAIDQMNRTAQVTRLFEIHSFERPMQEMGEIIVRAASISMEAVPLLRSIGKESSRLIALTENIIRLEENADELHDQGRKQLFLQQTDPITFMVRTEVYDHLEMIVDRFEDVANEISAIVIENV